MNNKLLLVTGEPLAGKDEVGNILLVHYGFTVVSTGNAIRKYTEQHRLGSTERSNLNKVSTAARRQFGAAWPVPWLLQQHGHKPRLALTGPRLPAEAEPVIKCGGKIIAVRCPIEKRYERAQADVRNRAEDKVSFAAFQKIELKEAASTDPNAHNLQALLEMAHFTIKNDGTLDELRQQVDEVIRQLS